MPCSRTAPPRSCGAGAEEGSAELLVVRHLQVEQVEAQQVARARHAAAAERFREADAPVRGGAARADASTASPTRCPTGCSPG